MTTDGITIDLDDNQDGSDGGYGAHGNYIIPEAMREIVKLRAEIERLRIERDEYARSIALIAPWLSASLSDSSANKCEDYVEACNAILSADMHIEARKALKVSDE